MKPDHTGGPGQLNIFDAGRPPEDARGQAQWIAAKTIFEAMEAVGRTVGNHHAINGTFGALITYVLALESTGTVPGDGLRRLVCDALRETAQHIERLPLHADPKGNA